MTRRCFVGGLASVKALAARSSTGSTFYDILRPPDSAAFQTEAQEPKQLSRSGTRWTAQGIQVVTEVQPKALSIRVTAPSLALSKIHLRWNVSVDSSILAMGDAWERSYGDLAWRHLIPERAMPWYFATSDGSAVHGYGVLTGAASFCFWQLDPGGISLWLDVSNGGMGVRLGDRQLPAATVVSREGAREEHPLDAVAGLCRLMSPSPRLPKAPVCGTNDWYYAYGRNSAEQILRDTDLIAELSPTAAARPFSVIDDGWDVGSPAFPDMARLAEQIRSRHARPGIWIRPLVAGQNANKNLLLPTARYRSPGKDRFAYDPTIPDALEIALGTVKRVAGWKYELIKHDYSTYDLLGQWGFDMGAQPARPGWHFHDRSRTTAEIITDLYRAIRLQAGDATMILGCNTVGHLSAGLFELQRTGDDTSGRLWERTRRMGVNTLAYRLPQNGTFFGLDADCVGITAAIPWERNRQWLDLVARSGSALFISPSPDAIGPEQRQALREAFTIAAAGHSEGRPVDWFSETTPERWEFRETPRARWSKPKRYDWCGESGCDPGPT